MAARVSGSSYFHLSSSVSFIGFYLEERKEEKKNGNVFFFLFSVRLIHSLCGISLGKKTKRSCDARRMNYFSAKRRVNLPIRV